MSMISSQCDKLRETADRLDNIADVSTPWVHCKLTPMLRDAADLILELRDDLQQANDENARLRSCLTDDAENARLIMEENAKLREQVRKLVPELCEQNADLCHENEKLRELCADMASHLHEAERIHGDELLPEGYITRMRELGIKVK